MWHSSKDFIRALSFNSHINSRMLDSPPPPQTWHPLLLGTVPSRPSLSPNGLPPGAHLISPQEAPCFFFLFFELEYFKMIFWTRIEVRLGSRGRSRGALGLDASGYKQAGPWWKGWCSRAERRKYLLSHRKPWPGVCQVCIGEWNRRCSSVVL